MKSFIRCRTRVSEVGDGCDGDDGRHDGVRDAGLLGHNPHANGQARGCGGRWCEICSARLLSNAAKVVIAWSPKVQQDNNSGG